MWVTRIPRPDVPIYAVHQALWTYFPEHLEERPFVYRDDGESVVMLSRHRPACPAFEVGHRIQAGRVYQFRVRASPMNNRKVNGRRKRVPLEGNDRRRQWLQDRIAGADLRFIRLQDGKDLDFRKNDGRRVWVVWCEAHGTLYVRDRAAFVRQLLAGIGGRGAWGMGLMLMPEIMPEVIHGCTHRDRAHA